MSSVMDYADGKTVFHKLNPITKIVISLCICIACFVSDSIPLLICVVALDLAIGYFAGVADKAIAIFKGLCKMCVFLFILQLIFVRSGNTLFLFITDRGVLVATKIVLRLIGATLPLALVLTVTKMSDLSNALVSILHVPYQYAFTLTTAMRFIPVFMNEMSGIIEAQTARGVEFDTKSVVKKIKLILPLCVPLLITSVKKADSSAVSAEVRGFNLRTAHSGYKKYYFSGKDALAFLAGVILIVLAVIC